MVMNQLNLGQRYFVCPNFTYYEIFIDASAQQIAATFINVKVTAECQEYYCW
jgi:UDP-N-acetylglucosamine transferase subunit ALG13